MKKYNKCSVDGCDKKGIGENNYYAKGYCPQHYTRLIKYGDVSVNKVFKGYNKCKVEGCVSICSKNKRGENIFIKGYCIKHYNRFLRYGDAINGKYKKKENLVEDHPLYKTYKGIFSRCYLKANPSYKNYGGRGIVVCDRWTGKKGFKNFCEDMGERPNGMTLDRIDVNGNYEPSNCRWATSHQQNANTRRNKYHAGVCKDNTREKWMAYITINKTVHNLGRFDKYDDALSARQNAEIKNNIII